MRNWAGNHEYRAGWIHHPESVEQVQELVRQLPHVRALGSRHSFNDLADSAGDLVALDRLEPTLEIDPARSTVTVAAGVRYGDLCAPLDQAGFALHNLASLPHISVAGACATATHGSGIQRANLATAVRSLDAVMPDGDIVTFSRDDADRTFAGAVVSLGGLGVVTRMTLDVEPRFMMRQDVYEAMPFRRVEARFDELVSSADSVSLFTDWRTPTFDQVWFKRRVSDAPFEAPAEVLGATRATRPLHPIRRLSAHVCTEQLGVPGPWHERLPHFRIEHTPSVGDELQSEYVVARPHATEALGALFAIGDRLAPLVQVTEIRTIAADELWLSPSYRRDAVSIHFTWVPDGPAVDEAMVHVEAALAPFEPRPHWAKLFRIAPDEIAARYPELPAFRDLLVAHDPGGKFRNGFLDRYVFGQAA